MKKNKWKEGDFVKIDLKDGSFFVARLFTLYQIAVYECHFLANDVNGIDINQLATSKVLWYYSVSDSPVKKGEFPVIGHLPLTRDEIAAYPPSFTQNLARPNECKLYFYDGTIRGAKPEECIGLNRLSIGQAQNLINSLERHIAGLSVWERMDSGLVLPGSEAWKKLGGEDKTINVKVSFAETSADIEPKGILVFGEKSNININIFSLYFPFETLEDEEGKKGAFSIFAQIEGPELYPKYTTLFEKHGYSGNGYCWEGHIIQILERECPILLEHIEFNSEAGLFEAQLDTKENQLKFLEVLSPIFSDLNKLEEYVKEADSSQIDD